ncbi:MAG: glycosyltransferase [Christiangramia sp.]
MFEKIDIGIVTFNRKETLLHTLENILIKEFQEINAIHIIDNNSSDGTENLPILLNEKINYIKLKENIGSAGGFAEAMNQFSMTDSDWLWLFNDDSFPMSNSLKLLKSANFEKISKLGLLKVSRELEGKSEILYWKGVRKTTTIPISNVPVKCDLVTFDGSLVSKDLIRRIGTCNPKFFMGTYEFDFCLRAKDEKYEIYTLPNGSIYDLKLGSASGSPPWRTYYNTRNHLYLVLERRSLKGVWEWLKRELKYTYGIITQRDRKLKRISLKIKATIDAVSGKLGKTIDPVKFR